MNYIKYCINKLSVSDLFIILISATNFDDLKKVIDTNFTGLLYCTKKALEIIKKDEEAHIFNINRYTHLHLSPLFL